MYLRINTLVFSHNHYMNLAKTQVPLNDCVEYALHSIKFCFATVGICVFRCVVSAAHFFIFKENFKIVRIPETEMSYINMDSVKTKFTG